MVGHIFKALSGDHIFFQNPNWRVSQGLLDVLVIKTGSWPNSLLCVRSCLNIVLAFSVYHVLLLKSFADSNAGTERRKLAVAKGLPSTVFLREVFYWQVFH